MPLSLALSRPTRWCFDYTWAALKRNTPAWVIESVPEKPELLPFIILKYSVQWVADTFRIEVVLATIVAIVLFAFWVPDRSGVRGSDAEGMKLEMELNSLEEIMELSEQILNDDELEDIYNDDGDGGGGDGGGDDDSKSKKTKEKEKMKITTTNKKEDNAAVVRGDKQKAE